MKGEILFLAHRVPFPPDRGDKIRSHHVLKHLASFAPVHVATFGEDARDMAAGGELAEIAATHCLVRRAKPLPLAGIEALATGLPVSLTAFRHPAIAAFVARTIAERPIGAIYVFSGQMGQFVPAGFAGRVICDLVDVDSAKFEAYAFEGSLPRRWLYARESRLLAREEARLAARTDATVLVSGEEAELLRSRLGSGDPAARKVGVLRNGIDTVSFDPAALDPDPAMLANPAPRLIFTGQMDYAPNVAAACRAVDRLMPLIRAALPEASLHIVGRNPPEALRARHGQNGCRVWGEVPDIRPFLAAADLALVPLAIARGVQNKVLEAMAMALPVVLTPGAACGIGGEDRRHLAIGENDEELACRAIALLGAPAQARALGQAARRFVVENCSWAAAMAPLAGLIGLEREGARDAA